MLEIISKRLGAMALSLYLSSCSISEKEMSCSADDSPLFSHLEYLQQRNTEEGRHIFQASVLVGNRCLEEIRESLEMEYMLCLDVPQQNMPTFCLPSKRANLGWLDYLGTKRKEMSLEYNEKKIPFSDFSDKKKALPQMLPSLHVILYQGEKAYLGVHELK